MDVLVAHQQARRAMPPVGVLPWEMGFAGRVLNPDAGPNSQMHLGWIGPVPPDVPAAVATVEEPGLRKINPDGDEAELRSLRHGEVMLARLDKRKPTVKTWHSIREWERRKAMDLWITIMQFVGQASGVFQQMQQMKTANEKRELMIDVMANRATSTLLGRAYQLLAFLRWLSPYGAGLPFPVAEETVYQYVRWLRQVGAKPTRASSFVGALSLLNFLLDVKGAGCIKSSRVMGAVELQYLQKRTRRPRDPLTASMLSVLEELMMTHSDVRTRVFVGFLLAMIHWRARLSDAQAVRAEPTLDRDGSGKAVYIDAEVDIERTKTGQHRKRSRQTLEDA